MNPTTRERKRTKKSACPQGHPMVGENVIERGGRRHCRSCQRAATHAHKKRVVAESIELGIPRSPAQWALLRQAAEGVDGAAPIRKGYGMAAACLEEMGLGSYVRQSRVGRLRTPARFVINDKGRTRVTEGADGHIAAHFAARTAVTQALEKGEIVKPEMCEKCGRWQPREEIHGHHADYSKPLEVEWLCRDCHIEEHKRLSTWAEEEGH
jgi:hypothetical protein